ncbi:diguanylate cyclase domain protein [Lysobacter capsici]|uniref:GGDEF domain-containing protein n=1 Tax=Lysobacter capsici TaxID=435897 RepID=UPI00071645F2|nr:diguanylate cyclase [Lysobacter capsici]ALN88548.1 diguanylate cyclase domain protein [Lysobacter capsici]
MRTVASRCWSSLLLILLALCASGAHAASLRLERLDRQSAQPEEVLAGAYDQEFRKVDGPSIVIPRPAPQWWRVVLGDLPTDRALPQLVLSPPNQKRLEVWQPGEQMPISRSAFGPESELLHSARALVVPLNAGLKPGDVVYLRITSPNLIASELSVQPMATVHADDVYYARFRASVLVALFIVALMSFGYFAALREHGYAYLGITLLAQLANLVIEGGEVRVFPALAEFAMDRRTNIVINTAAVLTGIRFLMFFLQLQIQQPRVAKLLNVCSVMLGGLLLASVVHVTTFSAYFGNTVMLVAFGGIAVAICRGLRRRQLDAMYLLIAWAPVMVVLVAMVGGYQDWWAMPGWAIDGFPIGVAASGLGLMLGLTARLEQVRVDRDAAQRRWTYDKLTGVITRDAVEDMLRVNIEKAHAAGSPLSVVFVDIDHFKSINDLHGHSTGDEALRIVALRIRNWLPAGHLVARYGGDEMLLVLVGLNQREALVLAGALRETVSRNPLAIDGIVVPLGLSMGVADLQPGDSSQTLLRRADAALYRSKASGRARVTGYGVDGEIEGAG